MPDFMGKKPSEQFVSKGEKIAFANSSFQLQQRGNYVMIFECGRSLFYDIF